MIETVLSPRVIEPKDWGTYIFMASFILIAITRTTSETRFNEFLKILISDKYIKVYKDSSYLMTGFSVLLFVVQLFSFSFFIQLVLSHFNLAVKTDWVLYIRIVTLFGVFVLSKFLIEKIIASIFDTEEFTEQFNLQKVSSRTFIGLLLLPVNMYLFYNDVVSNFLIYSIIVIVLLINLYTYIISLRIYQNLILSKLFYFILYLCALEIAPYYFIYYLITKKLAH